MEGVASEAASLAGTLKLGKLIVLYDCNNITIEGDTKTSFDEDVLKRFEAYGWQTITVEDGNDVDAIDAAIKAAKAEGGKALNKSKLLHRLAMALPTNREKHQPMANPSVKRKSLLLKKTLDGNTKRHSMYPERLQSI